MLKFFHQHDSALNRWHDGGKDAPGRGLFYAGTKVEPGNRERQHREIGHSREVWRALLHDTGTKHEEYNRSVRPHRMSQRISLLRGGAVEQRPQAHHGDEAQKKDSQLHEQTKCAPACHPGREGQRARDDPGKRRYIDTEAGTGAVSATNLMTNEVGRGLEQALDQ